MINENVAMGVHQPTIPSYWVGTAVASTGVVIVLVITTLYYYYVNTSGKRREEDAREVLREAGTDYNTEHHLDMECLEVQSIVYPKSSPSIFREGEFLMEVLEGIDNLHIDYGNINEIDCNSVTVGSEEYEKDLDVSPQLEATQSIRRLSDSKPSHNSKGIDNDLEISGQVGNGCTECGCPCPAIVLSEQYPPTIANIQKQGPYNSSERGERRVNLHPESTMLEVKAIFDTVLSELTEKGDYTKFDDSTIDEIHMIEFPNFESSTPVLHSNTSSPSDIVQISRSSRPCECVLNAPVPVCINNGHDEASSVSISLSSSAHLSTSSSLPMVKETLLVSQSQEAERPMFHLSLDLSGILS